MATTPSSSKSTQEELLETHMQHLQSHWQGALAHHGFDGAWLSAGDASLHFQDDHGPKFVANPYLSQWVDPQYLSPGARLLVLPDQRAQLFVHQPTDYWHAAAPLPEMLAPYIDIKPFAEMADLLDGCQQAIPEGARLALIGPPEAANESFGEPNPVQLTNYLHFHRACKTEYEVAAMRRASDIGVRGHIAASSAFAQGATEYEIHMAYLLASQQSEVDLPYGNIVALNEHGSILHYQFQERVHQQAPKSLLIDAGGSFRGFASDITRTHAASGHDEFAQLIASMDKHQQKLIASINSTATFADLHVQMHQQLAEVLFEHDLITCSAEAAFAGGLTETFCPHGLGHLLGLQVHDVGGHLADEQGNAAPPPDNYPTLRFTRRIQVGQVFTIEPGLYFIPSLLAERRAEHAAINWTQVEKLSSYGGIRIEDNVLVACDHVENLTRDAFDTVSSAHA